MADYDGILVDVQVVPAQIGMVFYNETLQFMVSPLRFSSSIKHAGQYSRELLPGEMQSVFCGVDAGERTISVWCYAPKVGGCRLELLNDGGSVIGSAENTLAEDWEELSVVFAAEKKVYIVRLVNYTPVDGDRRAYFDDLMVE